MRSPPSCRPALPPWLASAIFSFCTVGRDVNRDGGGGGGDIRIQRQLTLLE